MKINKKIIEELTGYLKEFNLTEISYSEGSIKVKVSRSINNPNIISTETEKKSSVFIESLLANKNLDTLPNSCQSFSTRFFR